MVVDDSPTVRDGLAGLLNSAEDIAVVAACSDGDEVLPVARHTQPDVVLMDVVMARVGGLEATRELLAERPGTRVVLLTGSFSPSLVREADTLGAVGFLLKGDDVGDLLDGVRSVAAGGTAWSRPAAACLAGGG